MYRKRKYCATVVWSGVIFTQYTVHFLKIVILKVKNGQAVEAK